MIVGGDYRAKLEADGTYTVFDVPIFCELPEGERQNEEQIGRDWMDRALLRHQEREREGYLPPAHVYHTEGREDPQQVGFFRIRRVGEYVYEGKKTACMFADLVGVPEWAFAEMAQRKLPYRSIEVYDWDKPEINALALLRTEVPYFRLALLTIGSVDASEANRPESSVSIQHTPAGPALCVARSRDRHAVAMFRFKEIPVEKPAPKVAPAPEKKKLEAKEDETDLAKTLAAMNKTLAAMAAKMGLVEDDEDEEGKTDPDGDAGKNPPAEPAANDQMPGKMGEMAGAIATLSAKLTAMETRDKMREKRDETASLAAGVVRDLKSGGWPVDEQLEKTIHSFAAQGKEVVHAFAAELKRSMPRDPEAIHELTASGDVLETDPPEVQKFAAKGPAALAEARKLSALFDECTKQGAIPTGISRERFIEIQSSALAAKRAKKETA